MCLENGNLQALVDPLDGIVLNGGTVATTGGSNLEFHNQRLYKMEKNQK